MQSGTWYTVPPPWVTLNAKKGVRLFDTIDCVDVNFPIKVWNSANLCLDINVHTKLILIISRVLALFLSLTCQLTETLIVKVHTRHGINQLHRYLYIPSSLQHILTAYVG